jgi:gamma-glutamyltranspeptidase
MTTLVVLKGGKPVLACSAIGAGLYEVTLQRFHNLLDWQMGLKAAIETPIFHGPMWSPGPDGKRRYHMQGLRKDDFPPELFESVQDRGQPIAVLEPVFRSPSWGF